MARFLASVMGRERDKLTFTSVPINGQLGVVLRHGDDVITAVVLELAPDGRIATLRMMRNPQKLAALRRGLARGEGHSTKR